MFTTSQQNDIFHGRKSCEKAWRIKQHTAKYPDAFALVDPPPETCSIYCENLASRTYKR